MRYLWTPSLPVAWSLQSDGPTRTWKWDKCEVEAQMGREPRIQNFQIGHRVSQARWRIGGRGARSCELHRALSQLATETGADGEEN